MLCHDAGLMQRRYSFRKNRRTINGIKYFDINFELPANCSNPFRRNGNAGDAQSADA